MISVNTVSARVFYSGYTVASARVFCCIKDNIWHLHLLSVSTDTCIV